METFANYNNNNILYYDYPFYKKTNSLGKLIDLSNSDALSQAIKIWMVSKRNEKIRSKGGGILYPYLGKQMDESQIENIKFAITDGLKNDFKPSMKVVSLSVIPDYEKERWNIELTAVNLDLTIGVNTKVTVLNTNSL